MLETTNEKVKFIAHHYGYDAQSRQCIEEMAELTQAINKFWRYQLKCGKVSLPSIVDDLPFLTEDCKKISEEIADVEIMLAQMKNLLNCEKDVEGWVKEKLDRQTKRIKEESK